MRLGTMQTQKGTVTIRIDDDECVEVPGLSMLDLIALGAEGLARAAEARGPPQARAAAPQAGPSDRRGECERRAEARTTPPAPP